MKLTFIDFSKPFKRKSQISWLYFDKEQDKILVRCKKPFVYEFTPRDLMAMDWENGPEEEQWYKHECMQGYFNPQEPDDILLYSPKTIYSKYKWDELYIYQSVIR